MRWLALPLFLVASCTDKSTANSNPLVGTWELVRYADTPDGGEPVYAFGNPPKGLFIFTADGRFSVSVMRNPPTPSETSEDPDPDACIPSWYCSYFGTFTFNAADSSWTTHVLGGNIPNYLGTDQTRRFTIHRDRLTISETYDADGKKYRGERILRRITR